MAEPHLGHAHRQRLSKDIVGETWLKMLIPKKEAFEKIDPGSGVPVLLTFFFELLLICYGFVFFFKL